MAVTVKHSTPADGTFSATGAAAWDADHNFTGTIDVANGGTGAATLTSNALLKGNGTSAISASTVLDDGTNVTTTSNLGVGITYPSYKAQISGSLASTSAIAQSLYVQGGTNLVTYSEQFDNAVWTKANTTITANAAVAPSGATTAEKLISQAVTATMTIETPAIAVISGTSYVWSVFLKASEYNFAQLRFNLAAFSGAEYATFNLSTGTITQSSGSGHSITPVGNGWYRCVVVGTATATTNANPVVNLATSGTGGRNPSITGDGTSGIFIWGAQLEPGNVASPYVATTASAVNGTSSAYFGGPVTLASTNRSAAAWTTSGINLIQSAATFTDTTSTGTVANVRINNFAAQTMAASNSITVTDLYGSYFTLPAAGTNVTIGNGLWALGSGSARINGQLYVTGAATFIDTLNFTGLTTTTTASFATGTTASGSTKTVNIGTNGASGSTTNITLGSATSGATSSITANGQVTLAPIGGSAAAWTTNGIALKQSSATWTDTTSTGSPVQIAVNGFAAQTISATNVITPSYTYGTYFAAPLNGTNVTSGFRAAIGADTIHVIGTAFLAANADICQQSTTATVRIGYGTTASGSTKTVNIGTGGASGSTTNITIGSSTSGATSTTTLNGSTTCAGTIRMQGYTVATLPAAGTAGRRAYVTDATAPTFLGALIGGGTVVTPVFDNGTAWVAG